MERGTVGNKSWRRPRRSLNSMVATVFTVLSGVLDILGGSLLLTESNNTTLVAMFGGPGVFFPATFLSILNGSVILVVAAQILRGNSVARVLVTILQVISIILSISFAIISPISPVGELVSVGVAVTVIVLLWWRVGEVAT